ncbi:MAG: anthranilate synthase component I [Candidatus Omnitrophota bacterium]
MDKICCYPDFEKFKKLTKRGNLIPVYHEMLADMETPVLAFKKIDDGKFSYLLESVEGQDKIGRFSFLASRPTLVIRSHDSNVEVLKRRGDKFYCLRKMRQIDPLKVVKEEMHRYKFVNLSGVPVFCGGMVGFVSYDAVRHFENIPDKNNDDLGVPECVFVLTETLVVFDHLAHKIKIIANAYVDGPDNLLRSYQLAQKNINQIKRLLTCPVIEQKRTTRHRSKKPKIKIVSNMPKSQFIKIVERAKKYIRDGDIIQVVLSQRFKINFSKDPFDIYRSLRSINPSPYMFFLRFDKFQLIGSSPEVLVRCEGETVEVRPIAGTRRRGYDELEDEKLEKELLNDPKERAEHIMLVDLGRNDIGRVCLKGSVHVSRLMVIEKYSHVMHIVSNVLGRRDKRYDRFDVLRAAFPAGTVTGAPKIRAMEIIDELEGIKRGPYAGCVGYFSFSGNFDSCITIRTILAKDNVAYIQAGAGIVADSIPGLEFKETQNKARALIKAIEMTEAV